MSTHIWRDRYDKTRTGDPQFCRASVYDGDWGRSHQCPRKGIVCREVNGVEYKFCRQHDPEAVRARL